MLLKIFIVLFMVAFVAVWLGMAAGMVAAQARRGSATQRRARRLMCAFIQVFLWCSLAGACILLYEAVLG